MILGIDDDVVERLIWMKIVSVGGGTGGGNNVTISLVGLELLVDDN
jgi:hypothetical protein